LLDHQACDLLASHTPATDFIPNLRVSFKTVAVRRNNADQRKFRLLVCFCEVPASAFMRLAQNFTSSTPADSKVVIWPNAIAERSRSTPAGTLKTDDIP
jgi:hypothetical protein